LTITKSQPDVLRLEGAIRRASKAVAYQWPGVVERDDVEQMIYERLLDTPGSVQKILAMDNRAQYRAVIGIGHQLASQERADYDIYKGAYRYSVKEVKDVLAAGILVEEFDHWVDVVHDLIEALVVLVKRSPQYVEAILDRYAEWNIPADRQAENALRNGLTALTDAMNLSNKRRFSERDDGLGTRKAMSRSSAQQLSKSQWDDESSTAVARLMQQAKVTRSK